MQAQQLLELQAELERARGQAESKEMELTDQQWQERMAADGRSAALSKQAAAEAAARAATEAINASLRREISAQAAEFEAMQVRSLH